MPDTAFLLTNATLVNWVPRQFEPNQAVLVRNGKIVAIGATDKLSTSYPDVERFDAKNKLLMPGNICAHTHFYGAFARGMAIPGPAPKDFPEILRRLWWPLDRSLTLEDVRHSALVCLVDAIKHGTTTLIDHHASPNAIDGSLDVIAEAVEAAGLRAVLCYEVTDRDGEAKAKAGIAENIRFMDAVAHHDMVKASFGLHASMTLSEETLKTCAMANPSGGFHIHVAEHEADEEASLQRYGVRVVERLHKLGILGERSIVAHAIHIDPWEMELLRDTGTWVTHQPRSNMNNGVGAADIESMLRGGINLCLGNDGFSNDMWAEWKAAYLLHKVTNRDPRAANGEHIVTMAAENNARLVQQFFPNTQVGTLAVGAAADMILVDYHPYTPLSGGNLPWHTLFGFESSMVRSTICGGNILMWDNHLLTLDEVSIAAEAKAQVPAVWERYREFAASVL